MHWEARIYFVFRLKIDFQAFHVTDIDVESQSVLYDVCISSSCWRENKQNFGWNAVIYNNGRNAFTIVSFGFGILFIESKRWQGINHSIWSSSIDEVNGTGSIGSYAFALSIRYELMKLVRQETGNSQESQLLLSSLLWQHLIQFLDLSPPPF